MVPKHDSHGVLSLTQSNHYYTYSEQPRKAGKVMAKAMSYYIPHDGTHHIVVSCR